MPFSVSMPWIFIRQIIRLKEYLWADPEQTQLQWRQKRTSVSFPQTEWCVLAGGRDNPPQPRRTAKERFLSPSASPSGEWGLCSFIWFSKVPINLCCYPWPWGGHETQTLSHTHTHSVECVSVWLWLIVIIMPADTLSLSFGECVFAVRGWSVSCGLY